jgi:tetratricopeptide (TPR) repeat protein/predicted Ser/Thr protein kinase
MIVGERTVFLSWARAMLKELQAEQQRSWKAGDRVFVDAYLLRYPELATNPDVLCDLILGELVLRENGGELAPLDDYLRRFPQCASQLEQRYHASLATALPAPPAATIDMPQGVAATLNMSPSPNMETIQLDEAGQLAAQEQYQQSVPKIPGYTILSELGRGGMGVVYRAKQLSVNRDVALKVVRSDVLDTLPMATRNSTLARFRHEAHAAARLEHDNLVPVYDVGEAGSLRYYAMRFVDGVSLYDMLRNKALSNQDAARYIEPVARGLHYAHEKGILHRDLKPHNIIVERKTNRPMLTDFGLAKFLEERNELTHAGDIMGTPSYMSPEQARDSGKVMALADVYSLGATLYHVLTSRPPFQAANVAETIRQVLDEEPVPPRRLNPAIDRDLETICLKCLQKEPARRYESSLALAEDLQRYLEHKPILARPAGMVERTWRWCRRNPRLAGTAALASLLLVFWVTSIVIGYASTVAALAESESRLARAQSIVDELFTEVSDNDLLNEPGMQELRKDLLAKALKHYQYFLEESANNPAVRDKVAAARYRVGLIAQLTGDRDTALRELSEARDMQEELLHEAPSDPLRLKALGDTLNALGGLYKAIGSLEKALSVFGESESIRSNLANIEPNNHEWQRLLANAHMNLGIVEMERAQYKIARDHMQRQYKIARDHMQRAQQSRLKILQAEPKFDKARRDLAMGYYSLGDSHLSEYYGTDDPSREFADAAIVHLKDAVKQFELLDAKEGESLTNRYYLSTANRLLSGILAEIGDTEGALAACNAAKESMTSLAIGNPKVDLYQTELAILAMNQGDLYREQENYPAARSAFSQTKEILERLLTRDPGNEAYSMDLAGTLGALGRVELLANDASSAKSTLEVAIAQMDELLKKRPGDIDVTRWLSEARQDLQRAQELNAGAAQPEE